MKPLCSILKNIPPTKIIDSTIDYSKYVTLDLSVNNQNLTGRRSGNSADFEEYIADYLKKIMPKWLLAVISKAVLYTNEVPFLKTI